MTFAARKYATRALALAAVASLAACAGKPKTAPVVTTPPPAAQPAQPTQPQARGPVPGSLEDFRVSVGERVFFDTDQYALTPGARATLDKQAAWLRTYQSVRIRIEGNADERGTREYNLALGARRAAAVKDYLVSLGVSTTRIETVSYGKERPLDPRTTEEAWALNRNARTALVSGLSS
ncbi:MAG: peptidoglycan-associated lipoprotein Pal [Alphaproteobacteria bacterium]|nr:peptidoglycan-associated lipoprotein Pal [Alphaproteobacteria bacterium]